MKKTVLIDFQKIEQSFVGLGQFCAHLKIYFDTCSSMDLVYWMPNKWQKIAKQLPFLLPACDVYHATHQDSPYMPWSKKTKVVLTIHDLNALYQHPKKSYQEKYKKLLQKKINRASVVTFISEFTKSEVEKTLDLSGKRLEVIYNGISLGEKSSRPPFIPEGKIIFSIGTVLPKKNYHVLIDFLKLLPPEYKIVLAGTTYHRYAQEMLEKIKALGIEDRLFLIGTINEEQKRWYYENSCAFVFPSLFEGFGLPVAEAMSLGLPLFISDKTSLPEIGGEDAYYFLDFAPEKMKEVFMNGMQNFNEEKKQRLIQRAKMFDWKKASDKYIEIYQSL
jgi:glycosyltransferase involved in cell wall biosynthesis